MEAIDEAEGGEGDKVRGGDGDLDRDEDKGAEEEKAAAAVVAADDGGGVDLLVGRKDELISPIPKKKVIRDHLYQVGTITPDVRPVINDDNHTRVRRK